MKVKFFQGWTDCWCYKTLDIQFFRVTLGIDGYFSLMIIILNFGVQIDIG